MRLPVPAPPAGSREFDAITLGLNATDHIVVVPRFPEFQSKTEFVSRQVLYGGQAASAAVTLARLGLTAKYVGRVGSDDAGRGQIESLAREGVDVSECRVVEGVDSQVSVILVDASTGERTVMWKRDDRITVRPDEISPELIRSARALHLDGHYIETEILAATWAREAGIPISIDVDKDYGGERLYPLVDYLITSEEFPARVVGVSEPRPALAAMRDRFGSPLVAMTLGRRGSITLCEGEYVETPGYDVEARDTTGAGDAFHGGFLYGLLTGLGLDESLRVANAVAALNCTKLGARGGLPTRAELDDFLANASTVRAPV